MDENFYPVDVITLCSADGEIRPLRLRVEDGDKALKRVNICKVLQTKDVTFPGAEARLFTCLAEIGQLQCMLELKYCIRTHSWQLLRRSR